MELSSWAVYTAAEVIFILLLACTVLLFHTKNLKSALATLQSRLSAALSDLKELKESQPTQASAGTLDYAEQLDAKLNETEAYHRKQGGQGTILDDLTAEDTPALKTAALRHHFLTAEKSAASSDVDWHALGAHYERLTVRPELPSAPEDAGSLSYNEQRDEIERFKRLFTTMESQWQHAKSRAEQYYQQLLSLIGDSQDPKFLELKTMAEAQLENFEATEATESTATDNGDLASLKAINAQQQQEITALQSRLQSAGNDEERASLIADLERQLAQQLKFMKESETCIDLLEKELRGAAEKCSQLERKLKNAQANAENPTETRDKQTLVKKIRQLESENEQLVHLAEHADAELKSQVSAKDKEIRQIKQKFAELAKQLKDRQATGPKA